MRSRLFHAIVVSSASFAGGCSTDPLALPCDAGLDCSIGMTPHDTGVAASPDLGFAAPPDMRTSIDSAGLQAPDGNMTIYDMGLAVGVAPIDGFGPLPDIQKAFDGGVVPSDMGMTVIYDLTGQKDLP